MELKAKHAFDVYEEYTKTGDDEQAQVYLKSEADKVIEELKAYYKEACDRLQTANLIKDEQFAASLHHKYKRCLAMARWCYASSEIERTLDSDKYAKWYMKWYYRWAKIADKFEEAK